MQAVCCPVCRGTGKYKEHQCHGCNRKPGFAETKAAVRQGLTNGMHVTLRDKPGLVEVVSIEAGVSTDGQDP